MQKIFPIILISFLLIFGIIFFWWPKYQEFSNSKIELNEKKDELRNKEKYFSELERLSLKLKEYTAELDKIDSVLPQNPGITDLLNFLEKESSQNGMVLEKVNLENVSPLGKESEIFKVPLSFSVSGDYPAFKNFLSVLQKNARLIDVESISFSSPGKGEVFSFDIRIKAHSY